MIPTFDQFATIERQAPQRCWFISGVAWTLIHFVFFIIESLKGPDIFGFITLECRDSRIHRNKEIAQCITNALPARMGTETHPAPLGGNERKGVHQKWMWPAQRVFILPTRDPVSPVVFKTFQHHVGIDKATYVRQVRPNL